MKEQILELAVRQMKRGGYENLNFADIAAELGTSRANLHHHFKNKEGLGLAATETYIQEQREALDRIIAENQEDIFGLLTAIENHLAEVIVEAAIGDGCIMSQLLDDREAPAHLRQLVLDRLQEEEKAIEAEISKAKKNGSVKHPDSAKVLSWRIMSAMLGVSQMAVLDPSRTRVSQGIKGVLVALVR